ncbi:MAG: MBL fold metallo-hydrolase [Oscillospiraceae bacterium]
MKIRFLGAAHEVTGSCTLLTVNGKNILIDCGMEQGPDTYENTELPIVPGDIDCLFLTHAHIDHSGRIPLLTSKGFSGAIYATEATTKLCSIMLKDSAHIQEFEAQWRNRKAKRAGKPEFVPLYTVMDAEAAMTQFSPCEYDEQYRVFDDVKIRFTDAGHLLGSSSIEITVTEDGEDTKIVFSGDIGNSSQPIIKDPKYLTQADYVIMESTYGDRSHGERIDYISQLVPILQRTFDRGGNVVIPSFAVGRTQELLYFLRKIKTDGLIKDHDFPDYVDSPLAVEATNIFNQSMADFDDDAKALIESGINPISFEGLRVSVTSDDSRMINEDMEPKVIISASGMCEAGRIRHHLKHNLWREESTILFVGYQAVGTLGRIITEGATQVKLFDEKIQINAEICHLTGISGHADDNGLIKWIKSFETPIKQVFVNHGEDEVCETFAKRLRDELNLTAAAPYNGAEYDLTQNVLTLEGNMKKIEKPVYKDGDMYRRKNPAFDRLQAASKRLSSVITHNEGGANKDLAKLADQIIALCDKWDR